MVKEESTVPRLSRFPDHRYVGLRDEMRAYDCDDEAQFRLIRDRIDAEDLVRRLLVASFGPDTVAEARNRGFRPR
jgi:hypothetical protein